MCFTVRTFCTCRRCGYVVLTPPYEPPTLCPGFPGCTIAFRDVVWDDTGIICDYCSFSNPWEGMDIVYVAPYERPAAPSLEVAMMRGTMSPGEWDRAFEEQKAFIDIARDNLGCEGPIASAGLEGDACATPETVVQLFEHQSQEQALAFSDLPEDLPICEAFELSFHNRLNHFIHPGVQQALKLLEEDDNNWQPTIKQHYVAELPGSPVPFIENNNKRADTPTILTSAEEFKGEEESDVDSDSGKGFHGWLKRRNEAHMRRESTLLALRAFARAPGRESNVSTNF